MRRLIPILLIMLGGIAACSPGPATNGSVKDKSGSEDEKKYPPCHPGCFPAGTVVATPTGLRLIESLGRGDRVTLVGPDGVPTSGAVDATFQTCNRLVEVRTDAGRLLTTQTQPLCLQAGGFRPAGEVTEGDIIWRWDGGERRPARVQGVAPTEGEVPVYNLVVGESNVFVANGFLARGKPPLAEETPGG
jgi:hypothetical protein